MIKKEANHPLSNYLLFWFKISLISKDIDCILFLFSDYIIKYYQMKKATVFLLFFLLKGFVFSQKISPEFVLPKEGVNYYSIYLTIEDLKLSESKDTSLTIDELKKIKCKKREGGYDHFAIALPEKSPYYGYLLYIKKRR